MSRLLEQMREAVEAFSVLDQAPALIGGLALAAHNVVRATRDIDFLVSGTDSERLHALLLKLGYHCVHRNEDAANYVRQDEGLDVLYAHRSEAMRLLAGAEVRETGFGQLRVISVEGLLAFKLQGFVNDPLRTRDLDDIRALLRSNAGTLDMPEVRRYFAIFDRENLLDDLLDESDH